MRDPFWQGPSRTDSKDFFFERSVKDFSLHSYEMCAIQSKIVYNLSWFL